jgi:hypothetical protein
VSQFLAVKEGALGSTEKDNATNRGGGVLLAGALFTATALPTSHSQNENVAKSYCKLESILKLDCKLSGTLCIEWSVYISSGLWTVLLHLQHSLEEVTLCDPQAFKGVSCAHDIH